MAKENANRAGCIDVFKSYLVRGAAFAGELEMPALSPSFKTPNDLIPFSQAISIKRRNCFVHFYEDDAKFERVWNNPPRYLKILSEFDGVLSPDFSVYRDMPLVMQYWNIYRSRAIAHALQATGSNVIPNIRFGDRRTWEASCVGIPHHAIIAVGSHGNLKNPEDRAHFVAGLDYVVSRLEPTMIIVYGATPDSIFSKYKSNGIEIVAFESTFSKTRKRCS